LKHRTGSLVSYCQLLAKLLDSPQQPASFPLSPCKAQQHAMVVPSVCLWRCLRLCAFVCVCSSERVFWVCEKAAFSVPYVVPYVVPMRALLLWKFNVSLNFLDLNLFLLFIDFFAFQSIFAFH
jgi:hypothetical protein